MWFAWKYLPLWYQQQQIPIKICYESCCDLLENIYLCGINNNRGILIISASIVVICLKISTFVVSTTTQPFIQSVSGRLWFAWKYLPLWYQQQLYHLNVHIKHSCDLLENIYLCGINNNISWSAARCFVLWFAWKYLPLWYQQQQIMITP